MISNNEEWTYLFFPPREWFCRLYRDLRCLIGSWSPVPQSHCFYWGHSVAWFSMWGGLACQHPPCISPWKVPRPAAVDIQYCNWLFTLIISKSVESERVDHILYVSIRPMKAYINIIHTVIYLLSAHNWFYMQFREVFKIPPMGGPWWCSSQGVPSKIDISSKYVYFNCILYVAYSAA